MNIPSLTWMELNLERYRMLKLTLGLGLNEVSILSKRSTTREGGVNSYKHIKQGSEHFHKLTRKPVSEGML